MIKIADLFANLSLVSSDFTDGLSRATKEARSAGKQMSRALSGDLNDGLRNSTRQVVDFAETSKSAFKDIGRIVQGIVISQAFYGMINSLKEATGALAAYNNELEQTKIAFKYLVGSADKADRYVRAVQEFAAVTPFTTESATAASKMLMSMGFASNQVLPVLRILSDATAVSGANPETFQRIVYALGQIKTSGKLMRQDLMQLATAGIPVFQILREELGLTQDQLNNLGKTSVSSGAAIGAILKGLQKRYGGAAEEISHTTRGLLSTIKDALYITGNAITKGLTEKAKNELEEVAKSLEKLRSVATRQGFGGILAYVFPPEMQTQVRAFLGYIGSLIGTLKNLFAALRPVTRELINAFIITFNAAAPIVIGFLQILTKLIQIVSSNTTVLRAFIFTMVGLKIASHVAKTVHMLTLAVRGLAVSGPVAKLVSLLARSVRLLYAAATSHPVAAIITFIAGSLLALALSSKTATAWIDRMTASLGRVFGFNTEDMWEPIDPGDVNDNLGEFYEGLKDIGKETGDVGKEADKAGKKVKDKFVASFDELHQIPDLAKDAAAALGGGLGDLGGMPKLDDFKMPKIENQKLPEFKWPPIPPFPPFPPLPPIPKLNVKDWLRQTMDALQRAWEKVKQHLRQPWPVPPPIVMPDIQWGPEWGRVKGKVKAWGKDVLNGLEETLEGVRDVCANTGKAVEDGLANVPDVIGSTVGAILGLGSSVSVGFGQIPDVIGGATESLRQSIDVWVDKFNDGSERVKSVCADLRTQVGTELALLSLGIASSLGGLSPIVAAALGNSGIEIQGFTNSTNTTVQQWSSQNSGFFSNWKERVVSVLAGFAGASSPLISNWVSSSSGSLKNWASSTATSIADGASNMTSSIGEFVTTTASKIGNWVSETGGSLLTWAGGTAATFGTWASGVGSKIGGWASDTGGKVKNWAVDTGGKVKDWCGEHKTGIAVATGVTASLLAAWATGGLSTVGEFVAGAGPAIAEWGAGAGASVAAFASGAGSKIAGWVAKSGPDIQNFSATAAGNIEAGKVAGIGSIAGFVALAGPKIKKWVDGSLGDLKNWKDNSMSRLKESCSGMGQHIADFKTSAQQRFSETWSNIKSGSNDAWSNMTTSFGNTTDRLKRSASDFRDRFSGIFGGLAGIARGAFSGVGRAIGTVMGPVIQGMNKLIRGLNRFKIDVPDWVPAIGGKKFGFNIPQLPVPGFENGGIIQKEGLIRAGERNKREMIVPLQNPSAMQPFADAIASRIQPQQPSKKDDGPPQILYVGTLIADERSLTELERKMKVIRLKEGRR